MQASAFPLISTRIKMRQLVLLAHLGRERSVVRAAEATGMTQPAASKLLKELEDVLGAPLFTRHGRGVEPTAYGELVLRHTLAVLSEIHRTQEEVAAMRRGEQFRVAIGSVLTPGTDMVPMALAELVRRHPRLSINLEAGNSRALIGRLKDGALDIVIGRIFDFDEAASLSFEELTEEPHSIIARAQHPLTRRKRVRLDELVEQAWVFPPGNSVLRERLCNLFLQRSLPLPSRIVETDSLPLTTHLLGASDMVVALPEALVRPYCEAGLLAVLPIEVRLRMDSFGIITRRGHTLSGPAQEALQVLRDAARQTYAKSTHSEG